MYKKTIVVLLMLVGCISQSSLFAQQEIRKSQHHKKNASATTSDKVYDSLHHSLRPEDWSQYVGQTFYMLPLKSRRVYGYEGFYTQQVESNRYDIDLLIPVDVSGFIQSATNPFPPSTCNIIKPKTIPSIIPIKIFQCNASFFIQYDLMLQFRQFILKPIICNHKCCHCFNYWHCSWYYTRIMSSFTLHFNYISLAI